MLVAQALGKAYGGHPVVEGFDLALEPGRIVGLVGANGAGKSTTLKMLAGLLEPTTGTVTFEGSPTTRPLVRRFIGYLPEESPLYDDQTPLSYLAFFGALYGLRRGEVRRRTDVLLERLHLAPDHHRKPIGTLSKGMRRKVAIARCLLHEPSVLILDEPTSGLDPLTATELETFIREMRSQQKAILLSAHNLPQVEELCDEILVMHQGRLMARGTLTELRTSLGTENYLVRATAPFPGSRAKGSVHEGSLINLAQVQAAIEAVRRAQGVVLEVESIPPKLEEILRRAVED